jgi:hypothetical protein
MITVIAVIIKLNKQTNIITSQDRTCASTMLKSPCWKEIAVASIVFCSTFCCSRAYSSGSTLASALPVIKKKTLALKLDYRVTLSSTRKHFTSFPNFRYFYSLLHVWKQVEQRLNIFEREAHGAHFFMYEKIRMNKQNKIKVYSHKNYREMFGENR